MKKYSLVVFIASAIFLTQSPSAEALSFADIKAFFGFGRPFTSTGLDATVGPVAPEKKTEVKGSDAPQAVGKARPTIASVSPTKGSVGTVVTITGTFSKDNNRVYVKAKGKVTTIAPAYQNEKYLQFVIPSYLAGSGTVVLSVENADLLMSERAPIFVVTTSAVETAQPQNSSKSTAKIITNAAVETPSATPTPTPTITTISPANPGAGDIVTITGKNFTAKENTIYIKTQGKISTLRPSYQSETRLQFTLPIWVRGSSEFAVENGDLILGAGVRVDAKDSSAVAPQTQQQTQQSQSLSTTLTPKVTSPAEGVMWLRNSTHKITWTGAKVGETLTITVKKANGSAYATIASNLSVTTTAGEYTWTVPGDYADGSYYLSFKSSSGVEWKSATFRIYGEAPAFSVTELNNAFILTRPNGGLGEVWEQGRTIEVAWTTTNPNHPISIVFKNVTTGSSKTITHPNTGYINHYIYTIPADLSTGKYKVELYSDGKLQASSANTFVIVEPSTTPSPTSSPLN